MKKLLLSLISLPVSWLLQAQTSPCIFKPPQVTIHFGSGTVGDVNTLKPENYRRVASSCPTDGHYTYTSYTSDCFHGDWQTLQEDHTAGDEDGNMMLVNASHYSGTFLTTTIQGLKSGTVYEFAVWMMNVCKISDKCPFPLLPNITILLQTPDGRDVGRFSTGELERREAPQWTKYAALFTTPPTETALTLLMIDNVPGGCGNDFALDDITFRECQKPKPIADTRPKPKPPTKKQGTRETGAAIVSNAPAVSKKAGPNTASKIPVVQKKDIQATKPKVNENTPVIKRPPQTGRVIEPPTIPAEAPTVVKSKPAPFLPAPVVLTSRTNQLVKLIETASGEIRLDLYDNGEIDGDTVSVYHNNALLVSRVRLSEKPVSLRITIDAAHPHHELIMVAHNLGSIPPNTSLMVVSAGAKRFEVFISSTEQKNAKVVFQLKE